ncbi:hypothetical protein AAFF_G00076960 [Aldrovandia affinis]|uniref:Uncharacterized protein n=1 Tax=Aldrovandia affinis TaxID=143900 RepID=A0AAD7RY38_9TELE|nr:hypothetical protein AAFF_G00076960 [Aldrovandia affinis]
MQGGHGEGVKTGQGQRSGTHLDQSAGPQWEETPRRDARPSLGGLNHLCASVGSLAQRERERGRGREERERETVVTGALWVYATERRGFFTAAAIRALQAPAASERSGVTRTSCRPKRSRVRPAALGRTRCSGDCGEAGRGAKIRVGVPLSHAPPFCPYQLQTSEPYTRRESREGMDNVGHRGGEQ